MEDGVGRGRGREWRGGEVRVEREWERVWVGGGGEVMECNGERGGELKGRG